MGPTYLTHLAHGFLIQIAYCLTNRDLTIALYTFRTRFFSPQAEAKILLLQMMGQPF
jgi:hypothetical protein